MNRLGHIVALIILAASSTFAWAVVEPASSDQVRDMMDKVARAEARITSLSFKCAEDHESHSRLGVMTQHRTWEVFQRGNFRSAARDAAIVTPNGPQQSSSRAVLNDQYFAMMLQRGQMAQQYLHVSRETMCDKAKTGVDQYNQLDLLRFGYGDRNSRFSEWKFFDMPPLKWHVEVAGDIHKLIGVEAATGKLSRVWSLDASKDFFIVGVADWTNDKVRDEVTVVPVKVEDNMYLPAAAHQKIRAIGFSDADLKACGLTKEDDLYMKTDWAFSEIKVNQPIDDSQFTMTFLQLPEASRVSQTRLDGTQQMMTYRRGAVVEDKPPAAKPQ